MGQLGGIGEEVDCGVAAAAVIDKDAGWQAGRSVEIVVEGDEMDAGLMVSEPGDGGSAVVFNVDFVIGEKEAEDVEHGGEALGVVFEEEDDGWGHGKF